MSARKMANNLLNADLSDENAIQIHKLRTYNSGLLNSETIKHLESRYDQISQNPHGNLDKKLKDVITKQSDEMLAIMDSDKKMIESGRKVAELFLTYNIAYMDEAIKNSFRKYYPETIDILAAKEKNRLQETAVMPKKLKGEQEILSQNRFYAKKIEDSKAKAKDFLTQQSIRIPPFFSLTNPNKINSQFSFIIIKKYNMDKPGLGENRSMWLMPRESYDFAKISDVNNVYDKAILYTAETLEHSDRCLLTYAIFNQNGEEIALLKFFQYNDDNSTEEYSEDPGF